MSGVCYCAVGRRSASAVSSEKIQMSRFIVSELRYCVGDMLKRALNEEINRVAELKPQLREISEIFLFVVRSSRMAYCIR